MTERKASPLSFWLSGIIGDDFPEVEVPPIPELLDKLKSKEIRGEASVYPKDGSFPRVSIDWHEGHGFVVFCFEVEESRGYFLAREGIYGDPTIAVILGGQAMEKWPPELFVPGDVAAKALEHFLRGGS